MQVLSRCPLEVAKVLWLPRAGAHTLTVVAKATFQLTPEESPLAATQDAVTEADSFWDHDERKSLANASDLVPYKRHAEVLLVGHAFAPRGVAVGSLVARLTVAEIDKPIDITGDRHFKLDGTLSHPGRFTKMPLRWERAAGGPETSNPVGVVTGDDARPDGWGRVAVPNLVPSGRHVANRGEVIPPANFGPLAASWPTRRTRLHRHANVFSPQGWATRPMPADFDMAYFNAAPPDQHVRELVGTERITLENLHPTIPLLQTRLAHVGPHATVDFGAGSKYEVPFVCDTLLIDTDRGVATLTYRAHVSLDYAERQGWVIVTSDVAARAPLPEWVHHVQNPHETLAVEGDDAATGALPFVEEVTAEPEEEPAEISAFDEEETFASVRTDSPFAIPAAPRPPAPVSGAIAPPAPVSGAIAPPAVVGGSAAPPAVVSGSGAPPMIPPEVPKGPRLGAFRLQGKSDLPGPLPSAPSSPPPEEIADDATIEPEAAWLSETANEPPTAKPPLVPSTPPDASEGTLVGTPFRARSGGADAATPFEKKLPGKIAPLAPGVPPPPPAGAAKEPPTFGFRRHGTLVDVPRPAASSMPFAPPANASATPFAAPGSATASATPFAPPPPPVGTPFAASPVATGSPFAPPPPPAGTPFAAPGSATASATPFAAPASPTASATPFAAPASPTASAPTFAAPTSPTATATSFVAVPPSAASSPFAPPPPVGTPFGAPGSATASAPPFASPASATPFAPPPALSGPTFGAAAPMVGIAAGLGAPSFAGATATPTQGKTIGEMVAQTRLPNDAPPPIVIEPPRAVIEAPSTFEPESTQDIAARAPSVDGAPAIVEPPRIGPLATPEMVASDLGVPVPAPEPSASAAPPTEPAASAEPAPLPLEKYPLERCARIAASIARTREKKADILASHELDEERWEPLRAHWLATIKTETERGKTEKLRAYDAAFVAQLEDERGPIAVEEYARIVVASERGTTNATLAELGIPDAAVLRIQRVWMTKMGKDPELRRLARVAVELASDA
ncbi:MAG: DUF2169 domain-containing protein [Polyangiaceae bacterium]